MQFRLCLVAAAFAQSFPVPTRLSMWNNHICSEMQLRGFNP